MGYFENTIDIIVEEAFTKGVSLKLHKYEERKDIMKRLLIYGDYKDGIYYLNELGVRYVMDGCSEGIRQRNERMKKMEELDIQIKKFTAKWQIITFVLAIIGASVSILHLIISLLS